MKRNRLWLLAAALGLMAVVAWVSANALLSDAFSEGPSEGLFTADGQCPAFRSTYQRYEVLFGNRGLSTLNSMYETSVGE